MVKKESEKILSRKDKKFGTCLVSALAIWMLVCVGLVGLGIITEQVSAAGSTEVSGIISMDTTWTIANSPYIVKGNILVEQNVNLTIDPGVTIKFDGYYYIWVDGVLNATGTENMITFTSNKHNPSIGDWDCIKFEDSSDDTKCIMKYCEIKYSKGGIICIDSSPTMIQNQIINNDNGIEVWLSNSLITNNSFSNNKWGIRVHYGSPQIKHNIFKNNEYGIKCGESNCYPKIDRNNISNNNVGIHSEMASPRVTNNTIVKNSNYGIYFRCGAGNPQVSNNTITNNGIGIFTHSEGTVNVRYNNILQNTKYNVHNDGIDNIIAPYNWWGTTNTDLINQSIYDYYDDFNNGKVDYIPFLTTLSPKAPKVNQPPVAEAGPNQNGSVNQTVYFDGSGSYDPDGDPLTYKWDFGDETATIWQNDCTSSHYYNLQGNYTVTLSVSDGKLMDNDTCMFYISGSGSSDKPRVAEAGPDQNAIVGQTVNFDGSGSYDLDGDPITYKWDFGDGTVTIWQNDCNSSHYYNLQGNYTVTLMVSDGELTDSDTCVIFVTGDSGRIKDSDDNGKENGDEKKKDKDKGIPGFEALSILVAMGIAMIIWGKRRRV